MFRNALKAPKAEREFFCSSVFLEAGLANWGRLKRIRTLESLGEENKQKKARWSNCVWSTFCAWIIFQMVSLSPTIRRYQTHQKSLCQHPCYCCQVPKFNFTEPFFSLTMNILPALYHSYSFILVANFRFFTPWCIFICSSLFSLFRTGPWLQRGLCLLMT